ncbi:MAG: thiamine pyrophosphate-binding protein, partial [Nitrososphaerales archaeon]
MSQSPAQEEDKTKKYASDHIVDLIKSYGLDFVALNPGATFTGIQESIANYGGNSKPEIIEVCHEEIAIGIAHGYAKAKGKPMVALIHDVVGLLHSSMAIFNAWCDRVPIMVLGGTSTPDVEKRIHSIDWVHTALVQGNLVRDYVKWDDQPSMISNIGQSFARAHKVAMTDPKGPVYICYDRDLQESELDGSERLPNILKNSPPILSADIDTIKGVANGLVNASNPVIVTDQIGRENNAVDNLIKLADLLAIPVIEYSGDFNFPNTHPMSLSGSDRAISDADVVLALECRNMHDALTKIARPALSRVPLTKPDAKIIQIGSSDLFIHSTITDFQALFEVDVSIGATAANTVPFLIDECKELISSKPDMKGVIDERHQRISSEHNELIKQWKEDAQKNWSNKPMSLPRIASEIWDAIKEEDWVLAAGRLGFARWEHKLWEFTKPYQYMGGSAGGGLGYNLPATIGAALAHRGSGKLIVDMQPDGDLLYVTSSLWTAVHHNLPMLVVILNNRAYLNDFWIGGRLAEMR